MKRKRKAMFRPDRLAELRRSAHLTLEGLAKRTGCTKSYIWELENRPGIRPNAELVYEISEVLGTSVDYLMSASRQPKSSAAIARQIEALKPAHRAVVVKLIGVLQGE